MLFPVFAKARDKAHQVSCLSNMKQIGYAIMMYATDWDDHYPNSVETFNPLHPGDPDWRYCDWYGILYTYVNNDNVFRCPSFNGQDNIGMPTDYVINGYCSHGGTMSLASNPSGQIALSERQSGFADQDYHPFDEGGGADVPPWNLTTAQLVAAGMDETVAGGTNAICSDRHSGGANYAFCDGHARWMKWSSTYSPPGVNLHNSENFPVN